MYLNNRSAYRFFGYLFYFIKATFWFIWVYHAKRLFLNHKNVKTIINFG